MYHVAISPRARKIIKKMSKRQQKVIGEVVRELEENPYLAGKALSRDLVGKFAYRIGVYRIIYNINQKDKIINILSAGHRVAVYD